MTTTTTNDANQASINPAHPGSCHCGAVRFQVQLDQPVRASRCNCSICLKTNITGAIVKPATFQLLAGEDNLTSYEWGGKTARRFFCKTCGIHCFARGYLVEVGGDYVSINLNAIDDLEVNELSLVHWDGRHNNWYAGPRATPWPIFTPPPVPARSPAAPVASTSA